MLFRSKIYVNVDEAGNVGSHKVDIQGNVLTNGHQALTNVALTTADSKLHGIARVQSGTLNLWLQNGAAWMNENYGTGAGRYASTLTKLTGGSDAAHVGVIFQQNTKDITIGSYSGHTKVFYAHDAATPTTIKGDEQRDRKSVV